MKHLETCSSLRTDGRYRCDCIAAAPASEKLKRGFATVDDLLVTLTGSEMAYAAAFADHLSLGDPEPKRPADVDPVNASEIRAALLREWNARLHRSPALSGRLTIERGTRSN